MVKGQQMACCRGEGEAVEGVCAGRLALAEDERRDRLTSGAAMRAVVPRGRMAVKVQKTEHVAARDCFCNRWTWRVKLGVQSATGCQGKARAARGVATHAPPKPL